MFHFLMEVNAVTSGHWILQDGCGNHASRGIEREKVLRSMKVNLRAENPVVEIPVTGGGIQEPGPAPVIPESRRLNDSAPGLQCGI